MAPRSIQVATFGLGLVAIVCWVIMFLAGTDVWHDVGRPDFWNLAGPPYQDLRAFTIAFYLLFAVLVAHTIVMAIDLGIARSRRRG